MRTTPENAALFYPVGIWRAISVAFVLTTAPLLLLGSLLSVAFG